ncbi:MAG: hypothetical protein C0616_07060 [Desulfuromonas sp.]|nr:MAG: hypothetical protein C0616_07060 [Desulfuromonas sp.]
MPEMKRVHICDPREVLLATLETVLKHWGYRVTCVGNLTELLPILEQSKTDLVLVGDSVLSAVTGDLPPIIEQLRLKEERVIALRQENAGSNPFDLPSLKVPVDMFQLFALIQRYLEKFPRRHLRLDVRLPGLLCEEEKSQLAEVLSISSRGLFISTNRLLERGNRCQIVLPLIGMQRELELETQVIYKVEPAQANNYRQGIGLEFVNVPPDIQQMLDSYLERVLMVDLVENSDARPLDIGQLNLLGKYS